MVGGSQQVTDASKWKDDINKIGGIPQKNENYYCHLVNFCPHAIIFLIGGKITFINTAGVRLTGAEKPEQLLGKTMMNFIHPDYLNIVEERFQGQKNIKKTTPIEVKLIRLDGSEIDVNLMVTTVNCQGNTEVQIILQDITERKNVEHLRNVLNALGPYILVGLMTPDGTLIEANRSALEIAELTPEDVLGKPFEETYWWSYSEPVKQQLRNAIRRAAKGGNLLLRHDCACWQKSFYYHRFLLTTLDR